MPWQLCATLSVPIILATRALSGLPCAPNSPGGSSLLSKTRERLSSERFSSLPQATQPVSSTGVSEFHPGDTGMGFLAAVMTLELSPSGEDQAGAASQGEQLRWRRGVVAPSRGLWVGEQHGPEVGKGLLQLGSGGCREAWAG